MPARLSQTLKTVFSAQGKVVLLALAAVALTALCSAIFIVQTRASIQAQVFQDQAGQGQTYARVVQEYLNGSRSVLEGLAQVPAVRAPLDLPAIRPELKGIPQDSDPERRAAISGTIAGSGRRLSSVVMVATTGDLYLIEPYRLQPGFAFPNLLAKPHIQRALTTGETAWSDVVVDAATNRTTVVVEVPIKAASGAVQSVLGSSLDLQGLADAAHTIQPGMNGSVMLFDSHGIPIIYPDAERIAARQPLTQIPMVQRAVSGQTGSFAYHNPLTDDDELGTAVELDNGWFTVVTETQAVAFAGLTQTTATLLVVLGVGLAGLLAAGVLLAFSLPVRARLAARTAENQLAEEALAHQSLHDALTGLPNRAHFANRLAQALARARGQATAVMVLVVDIDNLRLINDSLAHAAGDRLVVSVGQRLVACAGASDTVARLGSDEFAVLVEGLADAGAAVECAQRIQERLRRPLMLNGHEVFPTTSIGIAVGGPESHSAEVLLREADTAMCRAQTRGNSYELFDLSMAGRAAERLALESDLHRALERGEFRVYYQPIFSLANDEIVEVEALVRWQHPERGLISPIEFIPVAEETGLIVPLGQWLLVEACRQAAQWRAAYPGRAPTMGVNLSARQFQRPELLADIRDALATTGLEPHGLKLEITESVVMHDAQATTATLAALKNLGIHLAVDDFGTGYSSLSYLKQFPVDTLKIDRSFVVGLGLDAQNTAIVRSIIALAKALGLSVTGEGIETALQRDHLRELECDRGQGYLFARPQPAELVERLFTLDLDDQLHAA